MVDLWAARSCIGRVDDFELGIGDPDPLDDGIDDLVLAAGAAQLLGERLERRPQQISIRGQVHL